MITTPINETIPLIARLSLDHPEAAAIVVRDIAADPERYTATMADVARDPDARRVLLLAAVDAHKAAASGKTADAVARHSAPLVRWAVEQRGISRGVEQLTPLGTIEAANWDDAKAAAEVRWPAAARRSPRYQTGRMVVRPA